MRKVHNAHIKALLPELHRSLIDIAGVMNRPERDAELLAKAGLSLERALFPLLVSVERRGPIGVGDLADGIGRDYTTVSRQVARLEALGLVERRPSATDKRVNEAVVTPSGKTATDALDIAREDMAVAMFQDWERRDFDDLVRLMRMLAETMES
ncbi:MarR family winged helix-turn-helix transcriptional regulator [Sphingomonas nostoxanthinifaciens]|uniref:MarR family winged helix-turn-helix transcriptional regulator n=1 Tax=Sphingomonas nostoxanthinifaciens TaxID=2872652 RepID=UPI001CC1CCE3|nr:MarR family winged helix-turn-helix transcriptional regulator [Sphingomonas nostoxanthinifaciens]UAK25534.1 MarR family winged helix-turn-helix transcriptional regulator [Sphingomonas nostoxanthinifaciens]